MGKRREAREAALQFLYGRDLHTGEAIEDRAVFWQVHDAEADVVRTAEETVDGILENQQEIDALLQKTAANYEINRLAAVDRNILRIAIYEMLFCEDIPPVVSINEAIEIAKRFSTEESGRFVNGILDRIVKDLERPLREAASKTED